MKKEVLKKFGRYLLLDKIAQGGMAEIYRACPADQAALGRLLVIKKIQSGQGSNKDFQKMFQSETRVMMSFNHPNIVQLFDYGEANRHPYIAMELMDGKNLRQFISRLAKQGKTLPIEVAVYIIEQVAAGLHYAHSLKDKLTGDSLNIIHRDVSPQNILISFDGHVKIIDFGIAKASTNLESTRVGIIKGKPSYLSPEQIRGNPLDGRADVFALGIVLWEALTGKKLFAAGEGENEFAVLKLIENCETYVKPPSSRNNAVPKELDYIVLRSLAKKPEKRYANAGDFQKDLRRFLNTAAPEFHPSELASVARDLFVKEIVDDRKQLQKLVSKAETLLASAPPEIKATTDPGTNSLFDPPSASASSDTGSSNRFEGEGATIKASKVEIQQAQQAAPPAVPSTTAADIKKPAKFVSYRKIVKPPRQKRVTEGGGGRGFLSPALVAGVVVLFFGLFGDALFPEKKENEGEAASTARDTKKTRSGILLRLNITPNFGTGRVTINSKAIDVTKPVIKVPFDESLLLEVEQPKFRNYRREIILTASELEGLDETLINVPLEPVNFGYLTIRTTPSADAIIRAQDQRDPASSSGWTLRTPIENEKMPIGNYRIRLLNEVLGMEKTLTVQIIEGKTVRLDEKLEMR